MVKKLVILSAALPLLLLLLLLPPGTLPNLVNPVPIAVEVRTNMENTAPVTFSTDVAHRGILIGAMKRLMNNNSDFKFTYIDDPDYGPYLLSVNGLAGNDKDRTFWEVLVQNENGTVKLNVGIGCYIPGRNEKIILNFTRF